MRCIVTWPNCFSLMEGKQSSTSAVGSFVQSMCEQRTWIQRLVRLKPYVMKMSCYARCQRSGVCRSLAPLLVEAHAWLGASVTTLHFRWRKLNSFHSQRFAGAIWWRRRRRRTTGGKLFRYRTEEDYWNTIHFACYLHVCLHDCQCQYRSSQTSSTKAKSVPVRSRVAHEGHPLLHLWW